jgi:uncharacterized membrane protein
MLGGLLVAAVTLPVFSHLVGLPVRQLLPMHWPVLLAGVAYGWRGGAIVGLLSPVTSTILSGMPLPAILPSMTVELAVYGLTAGWLREHLHWNRFASVAAALLVGRVAFLATVVLTSAVGGGLWTYSKAALLPGVYAAALQVALIPLAATWWVDKSRGGK